MFVSTQISAWHIAGIDQMLIIIMLELKLPLLYSNFLTCLTAK